MAEFSWDQQTWVMSFTRNGVQYDVFRGPDGRETEVMDTGQTMKDAQKEAFESWVQGAK